MRFPKQNCRECARTLPHFQNPGCWYHVILKLLHHRTLDPPCRQAVLDACLFYDDKRWILGAAAVMPRSGAHLLVQPLEDQKATQEMVGLEKTIGGVKSYSARRINEMSGTRGQVWLRESYERQIRSEANL